MIAMQQQIQKLDEEYQELMDKGQDANHILIKVLALLIKNQLKLKEEQSDLALRKVTSHQKQVKESLEASDKIKAEQVSLSRTEKIAKVTASVLGVAAGIAVVTTLAVGAGSALLSCMTLGVMNVGAATTGTLGTYGTAALSVARGVTGLLSDYLTGKLDETQKRSLLEQAKKELEQDHINANMSDIKLAVQEISTIWAMLKEVAERHGEATKFIIRS